MRSSLKGNSNLVVTKPSQHREIASSDSKRPNTFYHIRLCGGGKLMAADQEQTNFRERYSENI